MTNPLLTNFDFPPFDQIKAEQVLPAVQSLIKAAQSAQQQVTTGDFPARWDAIATVLDTATERMGRVWGAINHLNHVADTPELRAAYNEALPLVSAFFTQLGADEKLYAKYKAIPVDDPANPLNAAQQRALALAKRNFLLSGADLAGDAKLRFAQIQERLAELSQKFSENALDATDQFTYLASESEVDGIPDDVLQTAQQAAQKAGAQGYLLTLKMPCYLPVMQFGTYRPLRETLYRAYTTRASDQAAENARGFDNAAIMQEILALRDEEARLLGYPHYAALSLATKMAPSPEKAVVFLRELAGRAKAFAEQDVAEMRAFAKASFDLDDPQAWDWPFVGERLKEARYQFSEQEVKAYFVAPKVLQGLFGLIEQYFAVRIQPDSAPVWHEGVGFYRIENDQGLVGHFYLDPGARAGKRGGAWMDDARGRWLRPDTGQLQTPLAYLVCNFASSVDGQPALLTHDDVVTLFHEFGHGLHHLLTQVTEKDVSGINGVEWDAVELPSQFMENFCSEWEVLQSMTAHVQTGQALPRALFDKMLAAKNFQSGLQTLRQVEFAMFDLLLHQSPVAPGVVQQVLDGVRAEVAVLKIPAYNRTANTFSHIFSGGYAAGYYSYKWAEVLSSDAYAAFEEAKAQSAEALLATGKRFKQEVLEQGGSRPAMQSFVAFRGREPTLDAMLRHQGMAQPGGGAQTEPVSA